jgi:hypothetical protein
MKTVLIFLSSTLLFVLTPQVCAQVGKSVKECEAEYGRMYRLNKWQLWGEKQGGFQKGNLGITVTFVRGKAVEASYYKKEGDLLFSNAEIRELLDANNNSGWLREDEPNKWIAKDGKMAAKYDDKSAAQARVRHVNGKPFNYSVPLGWLVVQLTEYATSKKASAR